MFGKNNKSRAGEFFQSLISKTECIAAASGMDVFWVDEKKQHGNSFGARFTNAFQEVFNAGYENVISIGNDCPYLTSDILGKSIQKIRQNDVVLGPASDGGAYLIGLNKSAFNPETFKSLSWQEKSLFRELLEISFQNQQTVECLDQLSDIDSIQEVLELMKFKPEIYLQFILYCLKSFTKRLFSLPILVKCQYNQAYFSLRAPPEFA